MNPAHLMPGQFVKVRRSHGLVTYWLYLRWRGVFEGQAVVEDATGTPCFVAVDDVFAADHDVRAAS